MSHAIAVAPTHSCSSIRQLGSTAKAYRQIAPTTIAKPAIAMDIQSLIPRFMIKAAIKTPAKGNTTSQITNCPSSVVLPSVEFI
jgi:hypothetical protein